MRRLRHELTEAFHEGDEARARQLVSRLCVRSHEVRVVLEDMLGSMDARERQAAAFGLGELGGASGARLLEQQLLLEEARGDYDGDAVAEAITQALGRIQEAGARASLLRKLKRLAAAQPLPSDVDTLAHALWRRRHPELPAAVRGALELFPPPTSRSLHALTRLLESTPEELGAWGLDMSVPLELKTHVLTILDEELPEELFPVLPRFISAAMALGDMPVNQEGAASDFCDRLFTLLLLHHERILPALAAHTLEELHALAQKLAASVDPDCSLGAVALLEYVGLPEDVALLMAHRPTEPIIAKVFDEVAQALRRKKSQAPSEGSTE